MYGRAPPVLFRGTEDSSTAEDSNRLMIERNQILEELKEHLVQVQNKMKLQADKRRLFIKLVILFSLRFNPTNFGLVLAKRAY